MSREIKYIGMDVHKESISIAVRNLAGKVVMECVIETKASMILQFIDKLRGERSRKNVLVRGLNRNCNHDLKNLFKGAAAVASSKPGPFEHFFAALDAKGLRPEMARLTLARKIATIVLMVWKKGVCFDASQSEAAPDGSRLCGFDPRISE